MIPKFSDELAWQQAELLMQPSYIRVVDWLRQVAEELAWEVSFETIETPSPGYEACLRKGDRELRHDLWDLCYRVCFRNYVGAHTPTEAQLVEIDTDLIESDTQEVDWVKLDVKAKRVVTEIFTN
jgi:hypothetical protein